MPSEETNKSTKSTTPHSSHSSCSSRVSQTSSSLYGHETWNDFAPRVHELCHQLWPSATEDEEFVVEKLAGGSYNRIIGIKTPPSTGKAEGLYILRIPRDLSAQQAREMAIVRYVHQHTSIPTPEIAFYDTTPENPLKEAYVVYTRIPGHDLHRSYGSMDHHHKLAVAEQWGQLLLSELAVRNDFAGVVDATTDNTGTYIYAFRPFQVNPEPEDQPQNARLLTKQSILDIFTLQFERWDAADRRAYPNGVPLDHLAQLTTVAEEMNAADTFDNVYFSLCHLDLAPRNVMATTNRDNSLQISGVLDWDSAVFGSCFVACEPPSWIWAWSDDEDKNQDDDYQEDHANDTPATSEGQELKRKFEEVVGKEMLRYFYEPQYRLARTLFNIALSSLRSNSAFPKTDRLLREWEELRPKLSGAAPAADEATVSTQQASIDEATVST